jgi:muramidase (phage lysozyme)
LTAQLLKLSKVLLLPGLRFLFSPAGGVLAAIAGGWWLKGATTGENDNPDWQEQLRRGPPARLRRRHGDVFARVGTPTQRAVLDALAGGESGGADPYHETYGGGHFAGDQFPNFSATGPTGQPTSASGRYGFEKGTWQAQQRRLGLKGVFSPENQDIAAWDLAASTYRAATGGRDLEADARAGNIDPRGRAALTGQWPGGMRGFDARLSAALRRTPAAPIGGKASAPIGGKAGTAAPIMSPFDPRLPPLDLPKTAPPVPGLGPQSSLDLDTRHHFVLELKNVPQGSRGEMKERSGPAIATVKTSFAMGVV